MKRSKKLYILLGVLLVLIILALVILKTEEKKEEIKNTDKVIVSIDPAEVSSLSWTYDSVSLSYTKDDSGWKYDSDGEFPVSEEKMTALLSVFKEFGAAFVIENVSDYSQYGLDKPTCTINLATASASYTVKLGSFSTMDSQRYVSIGDGNVYLVSKDPFDSFEIELKDTILNDESPVFDEVTSIQFAGNENYTISLDKESTASYCEEDIYFTTVNGSTLPLDTTSVKSYTSAISSLALSSYVSYKVTDEELASWGLTNPELTITVNYNDIDDKDVATAKSFNISIGRNQAQLNEKAAAEAKGEEYSETVTAYARVGQSRIVYQITNSSYESLIAASYNDLRHKELLTADYKKVNQIDISLEGSSYSITSRLEKAEGSSAESRVYYYGETKLEDDSLKTAVTALKVTEFKDESPSGKEEISMLFHLDNENHPESRITIYRYDGSNCLVVLDGKSLGLVSRASVVDLIEAVNTIVLG